MSRILRRPMFRGGRVDSRGTGITSGLGYEKGGRVKLGFGGALKGGLSTTGSGGGRTPFRPPMVINTGASTTAAPQGITYRGIFDALKSGGRGLLSRLAPFNPLSAAGVTMALPFLPSYLIGKANEPRTVEALEYMKNMNDSGVFDETGALDYQDFTNEIDKLNKTGTPLKGSGVGLTTSQEDLSKLIEDMRIRKEINKNRNSGVGQDGGSSSNEPSSDDLLDIDKEKFAKLLGSDKARGEDISNMLLSFAGKALKDDATVKSAFGEFASEEAKRPGRREKIDQAAATLAINEYIAGKKSKAELDRFFAQADYKASLSSRRGKKNIALNIADASKANSGYKAIDLGLRISFPDAGRPNKMDASEGQTVDKVPLTVDNIGQIFIEDEAPYSVIMLTIEFCKLIIDPLN